MDAQLTEARRVTMYPDQWELVERVAEDRARDTGGKPNISEALRVVVNTYRELVALNRAPEPLDKLGMQGCVEVADA